MEGQFTGLLATGMADLIDKLARTPLSIILILSLVLTVLRISVVPYLKKTPQHQRYGAFGVVKFFDSFFDAIVFAAVVVFMLVRPFVLQTFNIPTGSMIPTLLVGDFIVANKNIYRHSDPNVGDVIVFKPPKEALRPDQDPETSFIKRLVGKPGDVIEWKGKKMYRNGSVVNEPHTSFTVPGQEEGAPAPKDMWPNITQADFKLVESDGKIIPVLYTSGAVNGYPINMTGDNAANTAYAHSVMPDDEAEAKSWAAAKPAAIPAGMYLFFGDNRNGSLDGRFWGLVPRDDIIGKAEFIWLPFSRIRRLS